MSERGSRMHVLDWIGNEEFAASITRMIAATGMTVSPEGGRMPQGPHDRSEARIGKRCGGLVSDRLNVEVRDWWLAKHPGANVPNWDLACSAATQDGAPGLVLVEAKAHVAEFLGGRAGKPSGNPLNHERISAAVDEARLALSAEAPGLGITIGRWYQLANRIAFGWKLAASGIPTALVYLAFTGDDGVGEPIRDQLHWTQILATASDVVPSSCWERRIDCGAAPLWLLARSRACVRPTFRLVA